MAFFQIELDDALVETLEISEGKPAAAVLERILTEVVRCKTHHEAKAVLKGKHAHLPPTPDNLSRAERVRLLIDDESAEEIRQRLDIRPLTEDREQELKAVVKAGRPQAPMPHGNMGGRDQYSKTHWYKELLAARTEDEKKIPEEAWLRAKIKATENSPAFAGYRERAEKYRDAVNLLRDHENNFGRIIAEAQKATRFRVPVKRMD